MSDNRTHERWADSAPGLAIVAVVMMHVLVKDVAYAGWQMWEPAALFWRVFQNLLLPIRMPLFFLISGYFGARVIAQNWREVLITRTFRFYYLYAVWLVIQTVVFAFLPHEGTSAADSAVEFAKELTYRPTNLWFLFALAVFFAVARFGRRVPVLMIGAAAILSFATTSGYLQTDARQTSISQYFVFFLIGAYAPAVLQLMRARAWFVAAGLVSLVIAVLAIRHVHQPAVATALLIVATAGGVTAVVSGLKILDQHGKLPRWTVAIGEKTLPIYVTQMLLVYAVHDLLALISASAAQTIFGNPIVSSIYPALVTALVVAAGLGLHAVLHRSFPWLYRAPWLVQRRSVSSRVSA
ncbi:MAG: acyltransferase family protein [Microbacteriaceae bacterium]